MTIAYGVVDYVDTENRMVTVVFDDKQDVVSDVMSYVTSFGFGRSNNAPQIGDNVVCGRSENQTSEWVCLGSLPDDDEITDEDGQQGIYFPDGSYVYYDQETGKLMVKAMGGVDLETPESVTIKAKSVTAEAESVTLKAGNVTIEGGTSITGDVSILGNLSVSGTVSASNI